MPVSRRPGAPCLDFTLHSGGLMPRKPAQSRRRDAETPRRRAIALALRPVGPSVRRSIGSTVHRFDGPSVRRSIGPSVHRSIGPLVRRSVSTCGTCVDGLCQLVALVSTNHGTAIRRTIALAYLLGRGCDNLWHSFRGPTIRRRASSRRIGLSWSGRSKVTVCNF